METEIANGDWRNRAACLEADPELFFPVGEKSPTDIQQIKNAKTFCVNCLVRNQCLAYALETNQDFGIWGGMSEDERRALKRRARQQQVRSTIERSHQ